MGGVDQCPLFNDIPEERLDDRLRPGPHLANTPDEREVHRRGQRGRAVPPGQSFLSQSKLQRISAATAILGRNCQSQVAGFSQALEVLEREAIFPIVLRRARREFGGKLIGKRHELFLALRLRKGHPVLRLVQIGDRTHYAPQFAVQGVALPGSIGTSCRLRPG